INAGGSANLNLQTIATNTGTFTNQILVRAATLDPFLADNASFRGILLTNFSNDTPVTDVAINTNRPPVLTTPADRIVHAGSLVLVTNTATDADATNTLSFNLEPGT